MKTITFVLSDEQADRLEHSARCPNKSLAELLKFRLVDLFEDPEDPFDPRGQHLRERDHGLVRRIS